MAHGHRTPISLFPPPSYLPRVSVYSITTTPESNVIKTFDERHKRIANVREVKKLGWLVIVASMVSSTLPVAVTVDAAVHQGIDEIFTLTHVVGVL